MLLHLPNSALNLKRTARLNFETREVRLCENVTSGNEKRWKLGSSGTLKILPVVLHCAKLGANKTATRNAVKFGR